MTASLTPTEIVAISDDMGGASETGRRLGVARRTVSRWRAGDSAPERPDDLIDAWCVLQLEKLAAEMARAAVERGTLRGAGIRTKATIPAGVSAATAARMTARLDEIKAQVLRH